MMSDRSISFRLRNKLWHPDYRSEYTAAEGESAAICEIEKIARHSNVFYQFAKMKSSQLRCLQGGRQPPSTGKIYESGKSLADETACVAVSSYRKSIALLQKSLCLVETSLSHHQGGKLSLRASKTVESIHQRLDETFATIEHLKSQIPGSEERIIVPDRLIYDCASEIVLVPIRLF